MSLILGTSVLGILRVVGTDADPGPSLPQKEQHTDTLCAQTLEGHSLPLARRTGYPTHLSQAGPVLVHESELSLGPVGSRGSGWASVLGVRPQCPHCGENGFQVSRLLLEKEK